MADPNWGDVVFLSGYEGIAPDDEGPLGQTVTKYGTSNVSATQAKFGSQSFYVNTGTGSSRGMSVPNHANMAIGTQNFTLEAWVYLPATFNDYRHLLAHLDFGVSDGAAWRVQINQTTGRLVFEAVDYNGYYYLGGGNQLYIEANTITWTTATWHHVAVDFDGTKYRLYVNGVMHASSTSVMTIATPNAPLTVGCAWNAGFPSGPLNGVYIDEARVTIGTARYADDGGFTPPTAAFERGPAPVIYDDTISETFDVYGYLAELYTDVLTDGVTVSRALSATLPVALTDSFIARYINLEASRGYVVALADQVDLTEAAVSALALALREQVRAGETLSPNLVYNLSAADAVELEATLVAGVPAALTEAVTVTDLTAALLVLQLAETLNITAALTPNAIYTRSLTQNMRLSTSLARFFGAEASDAITAGETLASMLMARAAVSEDLTVSAELIPQFLMRVTVAEGVEVTAAEAARMFYAPVLEDSIEVAGGFIDLSGSLTTWAMNTRSGAVTEYDNYEFNSFAKLGDRYVGASDAGVYELLGDDDAGTDIIAVLEGGYMRFGGPKLSRLKAAYIAAHGVDGDFVLKIETLDGVTYTYAASTRTGRSMKVHMGKGQRAHYFAYTLTSTGQDFDLDTLEFVPLPLNRRV